MLCAPGFAYVGGACVVNKRLEKVNSVAIIEDTGGFSGIIVAAHEVGHLWVEDIRCFYFGFLFSELK